MNFSHPPMIILYVKNQEKSKRFYEVLLGCAPTLDVPGMTEFPLGGGAMLGLMPEDGIHRLLTAKIPHPSTANGAPRCELYLTVDDPQKAYQTLLAAGGTGICPAKPYDWGDTVAYGTDPDGHIIAFAKNLST